MVENDKTEVVVCVLIVSLLMCGESELVVYI